MQIFDQLKSMQLVLDYHLDRQNLIHSNLANIETPYYQSQDVGFSLQESFAELPMNATHKTHLSLDSSVGIKTRVFGDGVIQPGNDHNTVSLEHEMAKLSSNSIRYQALSDIMSRRLAMLRYSASDGNG